MANDGNKNSQEFLSDQGFSNKGGFGAGPKGGDAEVHFTWKGGRVTDMIVAGIERNLDRAVIHAQNTIREIFGSSGIPNASRGERESNRSNPWEPPHIQTGYLQANIQTDKPAPLTRRVGTGVGNAKSVSYGMWLEFGTRNMFPRPWIRPGIFRARPGIKRHMLRKVN